MNKAILLSILALACSCQTIPVAADEPLDLQFPDMETPAIPEVAKDNSDKPKIVNGFMILSLSADVDDESVGPLIKALSNSAGLKGFILEINSDGGYVHSGFMLVKAMENAKVPVHCAVDGRAQSMAFYILQGCTTRSMTKRSMMMIHNPSFRGGSGGNSNTFFELGENLLAMQNGMIEHYIKRMNITKKQMQDRLAIRNWYLEWEEAKDLKAIDYALDSYDQIYAIAASYKK